MFRIQHDIIQKNFHFIFFNLYHCIIVFIVNFEKNIQQKTNIEFENDQ